MARSLLAKYSKANASTTFLSPCVVSLNRIAYRNMVLGREGFCLRLLDPKGMASDTVGNLDGDRFTKDEPMWEMPSCEMADDARTSLMRQYREIGVPFDGTTSASWKRASEIRLEVMTYWGKETDIGNPGYRNEQTRLPGEQVSFSELMFATEDRRRPLPQWIELYNDADIETVNLKHWHLEIEGRDNSGKHYHGRITFEDLRIPPHQTALLVTGEGRSSGDIPPDRVYNLSHHHAGVFNSKVLEQTGFFLRLLDPEGAVSDVVGNLDGAAQTRDAPMWELPSCETSEGVRTSLMRRYYHVTGVPLDGSASSNWVPASNLPLTVQTYWGRETDIGNPGYRGGGPLPVQLSHFRPERTDTGSVVIKWTTASETNNAGFNILRGQQREGRFVRLNPKLIPGAGTTSERHDYTWKDTTASPQVVYYYRLEDVSFSGQQRQLGTVRLRGHVSAGGKLMTRWGDLKQKK